MGCMDNMAISSGLKCCFDKLAHIQDSCLPNQGHLNSAARHYCCYFVEHLYKISVNISRPLLRFRTASFQTVTVFIAKMQDFFNHRAPCVPPPTVTVAVRVHPLSPPPFLFVPSSSLACCRHYRLARPSGNQWRSPWHWCRIFLTWFPIRDHFLCQIGSLEYL